ncbi:MAG: YggS family pyridoxal phosphate-dependent enzyme [Bacteroidota bacterium]
MIPESTLADRWQAVNRRVIEAAGRSGRDPAEVTVVAVTKNVPAEEISAALRLGLRDLGENRVQEGLAKQACLGRDSATWHLIGSLQTNKAKRAAEAFHLIHALDRWELALALAGAGERMGRSIPVLIQVNASYEASKHGLDPGETMSFVRRIMALEALSLHGLMTMAPVVSDPGEARPVFRMVHDLFRRVRQELPIGDTWRFLSMGMSQDFEVAIEEGANLVRIGTAIFGQRRPAGR